MKQVAVIGAGATGLSAALALQDAGCQVTVYESSDRIGGKCKSTPVEGNVYELGAIGFYSGLHVPSLAKRFGRSMRKCTQDSHSRYLVPDSGQSAPFRWSKIRVALDLLKLNRLHTKWRKRVELSFEPQPEEGMSASAWMRSHRLEAFEAIMAPLQTGCGYGALEDVSAHYFLISYSLMRKAMNPFAVVLHVEGGIAALWRDVAATLNVRLSTPVLSVSQDGLVETSEETRTYDAIVVACPIPVMRSILRFAPDEASLLENVRHLKYHSFVFAGAGMKGAIAMFPEWAVSPESERPTVWYRAHDYRHFQTWLVAPDDWSKTQVVQRIRDSASEIGAVVGETILHECWDYFPHFSMQALAGGARSRLEAMRRRGRVWLAGELFSFSTVEHASADGRAIAANILDSFAQQGPDQS